jgi:transcriptional regulator with XRE-family HTH domain
MDLVPMLGPVRDLGEFIRDQRQAAQLTLRGLAAKSGISNPYLSQVERGLRRPSAEILAQIAQGLSISVESLLAKAGVLPDRAEYAAGRRAGSADVVEAILADGSLTRRQQAALIEIYRSFAAERDIPATDLVTASKPAPNDLPNNNQLMGNPVDEGE